MIHSRRALGDRVLTRVDRVSIHCSIWPIHSAFAAAGKAATRGDDDGANSLWPSERQSAVYRARPGRGGGGGSADDDEPFIAPRKLDQRCQKLN